MSRTNRPAENAASKGGRRKEAVTVVVALGLAASVIVGVFVGSDPRDDTSAMPVTATTGMVQQAGLKVEGSTIDLGVVPLDTTVTPTWTITNTGSVPVALGEAHASVIEGCCPGPLTYSDPLLEPGESTRLAFPLQMHAGMDGPHDFDVHVPYGDGPEDYLTLKVVGTFTG